ncbi:MAG TPA: ThuA domain-containing protein [Flavipsychrobacter sp.]|nr:ThuA domain-containing protein [Flavipsychrobacter sp.]
MRVWTIILCCIICIGCNNASPEPGSTQPLVQNVLILTKTNGFRHTSIEAGTAMFLNNATAWNISPVVVTGTNAFVGNSLDAYDVIVLLNTTGDIFNAEEQSVLQQFVRRGGGILAIHAATDAEYDWPWYGQMLGAWFDNHPAIQLATCKVPVSSHPAVANLPQLWQRTDEWYNFKQLQPDNHTLITVDESSYTGGTHGASHPMSWYRYFDGGRVFYTAMGHTEEAYSEPLFKEHIKGALQWLAQ